MRKEQSPMRIGPPPGEQRLRPDNCSDAGYGESVPGGNTQVPVSGDQFPAQARGCTPQIGDKLRKPPTVGPAGPWMT